ncbi:hypothetical protein Mapa_014678 [Marchantia paleacea]|nr:hypothetical protein Mapa_014678 [Marchantia paleacea]
MVPPSHTFISRLTIFDMKIMDVFDDVIEPGPFECVTGDLAQRQISMPISCGRVGLLSMDQTTTVAFLAS